MQVNLDINYIEEQIRDSLDVVDWSTIEGVYVTGSFANESKKVTESSDLDVELVVTEYEEFWNAQGEVSCYDGMNPALIHITANDGRDDYDEREMDLIVGSKVTEDVDLIKIV